MCIAKNGGRHTTSTKCARSRDSGLEFAPASAGYARPVKPDTAELLGRCQRMVLVVIIWHAVEMTVDMKEGGVGKGASLSDRGIR